MSLHPSLRIDSAGEQQRTVLSRIERIKDLMKKGLWVEGQLVTGLPKTKILKVKAKKKVKEPTPEEAAAAAAGETAAAPADAKEAKPGKAAEAKPAKAEAKAK